VPPVGKCTKRSDSEIDALETIGDVDDYDGAPAATLSRVLPKAPMAAAPAVVAASPGARTAGHEHQTDWLEQLERVDDPRAIYLISRTVPARSRAPASQLPS
jgi:hypothetical protein